MRRFVRTGAALALVSALALSIALAQQPPGKSHLPPAGALVAPGEAPDVTLLYTGDVIGYLDPCG
jgi:hypothetical protein